MAKQQTTPGQERLTRAIAVLETQLRSLARDLAVLHRDIRAGKLETLADAQRRSGEIRQWLGIALEMEMKLEKRGQHGRRTGAGGSIDLDAARTQIGCRLDRLRRARCPGRFPE
ncbi:hypothetical protein [Marimonas arenosa]|uniref:Uncharacterized protein n=1 Tax=Marimonas arenosa TaxID=1795305 RepID=A0AAE4B2L2_9RHOB|nr:hypothetical protein [Marimonas arenosa]MDQ2089148.1 hypothetical protein [Marimonas arenosa]